MKLIITGASGNVGKMLVPILASRGVQMLLMGRDIDALQKVFPNHQVSSYDDLRSEAKKHDGILHLAVLNNDQSGSFEDFHQVNVEFLKEVIGDVENAKLKFFIYPTSMHAAKEKSGDPYSQTKFMAEELLRSAHNLPVRMMRLPAVYGDRFSGKLSVLNKVPKPFKGMFFNILASIKLTVSVEKIADAIINAEKKDGEFIVTDQQQGNWFYKTCAILIDYGFALFVLFFLWWLILLGFIFVKLTSKGPGIFAQTRVGQHGKEFTCYKLRTMQKGTVQGATHNVSTSNITSVGHFLRKTKLDELPQAFNILKGEMSLIGPRPCLPVQEDVVDARKALSVLDVKPGITGWAQANGIDMSDPEKLAETDRYFMDMRTLPMLLKIMIKTVKS